MWIAKVQIPKLGCTLKRKTMRLGITQNNFLSYLGIIGVGLAIVFTMKLIPNLRTTPTTAAVIETSKTLRHVVLFKFKEVLVFHTLFC